MFWAFLLHLIMRERDRKGRGKRGDDMQRRASDGLKLCGKDSALMARPLSCALTRRPKSNLVHLKVQLPHHKTPAQLCKRSLVSSSIVFLAFSCTMSHPAAQVGARDTRHFVSVLTEETNTKINLHREIGAIL